MRETVPTNWHVVVENAGRSSAGAQIAALDRAGFTVVACGGPDALPGRVCPLVTAGRCPWIDAADVVLHDLDPDKPEHLTILQTLRRIHSEVPVVVEVPVQTARDHVEDLDGCHVVYPFDMDRLVGAVIDAAEESPRRGRQQSTRPPAGRGRHA